MNLRSPTSGLPTRRTLSRSGVALAMGLALFATAQVPAQPGVFDDHVFRSHRVTGAVTFLIADGNQDGHHEVFAGAPGSAYAWRFEGTDGSPQNSRGSSGSRYGSEMVVGHVTGTAQLEVVVMSTAFGRESIQVLDYNTMLPITGAQLPPDFGAITGIELVQADADPWLEVAIASRAHQGGRGAVLIYDAQTNSFSTRAVGSPGAEFATSIEVLGSPDTLAVASAGTGVIDILDTDDGGPPVPLATLPVGAGRDGMTLIDSQQLMVRSHTGYLPFVQGRMDVVDTAWGSTSPFQIGQQGDRFASSTRAGPTGQFYWTKSTVGGNEEIFENDNLSAPPRLAVRGFPTAGLEVAEIGSFNPFPTTALKLIAIFERSTGTISLYNVSGPLDLRMVTNRVSAGGTVQIDANFGPSAAGATMVPLISASVPRLLSYAGINVAFTWDQLSALSYLLIPGAVADANGRATLTWTVPSLPLGGFTLPVSHAVLVIDTSGTVQGSQCPTAGHVLLR